MAKAEIRIKAVNETSAAFSKVNSNINRMQFLAKSAAKVLAGLFIVRGAVRFINNLIETGDKLQKMAIQTGASVEALSQLEFAVRRSGVSVEALGSSLLRMRRRIGLAAKETGAAKEALKQLGLSAIELAKLDTEDQLEIIAERMVEIKDASVRAAFAFEIFGTQGQRLLPLLDKGAKGIQELRQRADELGITMSTESAQGFAKAADATLDMQVAIKGLVRQLTVTLGPAIADTVNFIRRAFTSLPNMMGLVASKIQKTWQNTFAFLLELQRTTFTVLSKLPGSLGETYENAANEVTKSLKKIRSEIEILDMQSDMFADNLVFDFKPAIVDINKLGESMERTGKIMDKVFSIEIRKAAEARLEIKKMTEAQKKLEKEQKKSLDAMNRQLDAWSDRTADAFLQVKDVGISAFGDLVTSILSDIARLAIQANVVKPLFNALQSGVSGGAGGGIASSIGSLFGGFFAKGGRPPQGKASVVGERGPELFVPDTAGTVIPNGGMKASGGDTAIKIEIINQSSTPVEASQGGSFMDVDGLVQTVILKDLKDGGKISKGFQQVFNARRSAR